MYTSDDTIDGLRHSVVHLNNLFDESLKLRFTTGES